MLTNRTIWRPGAHARWPEEVEAERRRLEMATRILEAVGLHPVMGAAADAWSFYQSFREYLGDGTIDMDGDTFKLLLTTSSYTPNAGTHDTLSDISGEVSGNGYARATLASVTWTRSGATVTFDSDDVTFTADGGDIVCRHAVIYDDTPTSPADPLVCYTTLDNTPADITVPDGGTLTIRMNASGIFTLS